MKTLEIIDYEKIENLNKASYAVNRNVGRDEELCESDICKNCPLNVLT